MGLPVDDDPATLAIGQLALATYDSGAAMEPTHSPRPFLHPIRTVGAITVSEAPLGDHPWHHGLSFAIQDVSGTNFWGGRTYVADVGYVDLDNHGTTVRTSMMRGMSSISESLEWRGPDGLVQLIESRELSWTTAPLGWELQWSTVLSNPTPAPTIISSPGAKGLAGSGYGGLFLRMAAGPDARILRPVGGEQDRIAVATDDFTVAIVRLDHNDPWFTRTEPYLGLGSALASQKPLRLHPGGALRRDFALVFADGRQSLDNVSGHLPLR